MDINLLISISPEAITALAGLVAEMVPLLALLWPWLNGRKRE